MRVGSPSDLKYALESPVERALLRARYHGPRPLPAVFLAAHSENPAESWLRPPGMDETQDLALRALRDPLASAASEGDHWDELLAANRSLIKAIATGRPVTRKNARIVAEYLREAGWRERSIGAATEQTGIHAGAD